MAASAPERVVCALRGCDNALPKGRQKFCSDRCRDTSAKRRHRARKRGLTLVEPEKPINEQGRAETTADGRVSARRPPDHFVEDGWFDLLADGEVTQAQAARSLETTDANVSRWFEWCKRERMIEREAAGWQMGEEARRALGDFRFFRDRYFKIARGPAAVKGKPPATTEFHMRWIEGILDALPAESGGTGEADVGKRLMILSPPRHGKSLLLSHFVIWLILRNPDVVILWVAKSEPVARRFGSMIRDELERNELLIAEMLGPGGSFKPENRSGAQWRDDEFEVATRTTPQPAPTFKAIGRGANVQSMDVDFLVCDDIENFDSTRTPESRQTSLDWFLTEPASRKEEQTAWVVIGSRNHAEDIPYHILNSSEWETIVETAHDHDCERPLDDPDSHNDCVLWPGVRTYRFLMGQREDIGEARFALRYLNDPRAHSETIFSETALRACLDSSRNLGDAHLVPPGYELLGSIDPSPGVHQIAELWAWSRTNPVRYLVDIITTKGGIDAWEALVKDWLGTYGLGRWVVEANSAQSDYVNRREFLQWRQDNAVLVHAHKTGANKHSLGLGVRSMHPLYVKGQIVLPYGDANTRGKIDAFVREHVNYDPDRTQRDTKWRIDRVMTAWFANVHIDTLQGGRVQNRAEDNLPDWMTPDGLDWIEDDVTEGWL